MKQGRNKVDINKRNETRRQKRKDIKKLGHRKDDK